MSNLLQRSQMAPPYRAKDLLPLRSFISYCEDRGVETSEEQLEYYDQHNLLLPAVRVDPGYVEHRKVFGVFDGKEEWRFTPLQTIKPGLYKKVDPQPYFSLGGLSVYEDPITKKDWLDFYRNADQVIYPSQVPFKPWKEYKGNQPKEYFVTDPNEFGVPYESFYSKYQVFALQEIHKAIHITLSDTLLFRQGVDWAKVGKNLHDAVSFSIPIAQKNVLWIYEIIDLYQKILGLREKEVEYFDIKFSESLTEWDGNREEAQKDASHAVREYEKDELPKFAKDVLKTINLSVDEIEKRRERIIYQAKWVDPTAHWFNEIETIPGESLGRSKGIYRLVLDYYNLANYLEWFLNLIGKETISLKKIYWGSDNWKTCVVCHNKFEPEDIRQITCSHICSMIRKSNKSKESNKRRRQLKKR